MLQQPVLTEDSPLQLLVPSLAHLDAYADALRQELWHSGQDQGEEKENQAP